MRSARIPTGLAVGMGFVTVIGAALIAGTALSAGTSAQRLSVVAVAVFLFGLATRDRLATVATAGIGWLVVNGFLVDHYGVLSWHGAADLIRVAVLLAVCAGSVVPTSHPQELHQHV